MDDSDIAATGTPGGLVPPEHKDVTLTFEESRVLGCLIEKERTTPEYYPLTLNALNAACNQKNNRNPVAAFDEATVVKAMEGLRFKKLAVQVSLANSRVLKYKHWLTNVFRKLEDPDIALLTVLMLRGPQTVGELRGRTERMHPFADLQQTEERLLGLAEFQPQPLVTCLPPGSGHKTKTYAHLLCGDIEQGVAPMAAAIAPAAAPAVSAAGSAQGGASTSDAQWRESIEGELDILRKKIEELEETVELLQAQPGGGA